MGRPTNGAKRARCWAWWAATIIPGGIFNVQGFPRIGVALYAVHIAGVVFGPGLCFWAYKRFRWARRFDLNLDGNWVRR